MRRGDHVRLMMNDEVRAWGRDACCQLLPNKMVFWTLRVGFHRQRCSCNTTRGVFCGSIASLLLFNFARETSIAVIELTPLTSTLGYVTVGSRRSPTQGVWSSVIR